MLGAGTEEIFLNKKWIKFETKCKLVKNINWVTGAGTMVTSRNCSLNFKLDEFSTSKTVKWIFHVDETEISQKNLGYDMIVGLDLMSELGLIINYEDKIVEWKELKIHMTTSSTKFKNKQHLNAILESTQEPKSTRSEQSRLIKILDADYKPANLDEIVRQAENLN